MLCLIDWKTLDFDNITSLMPLLFIIKWDRTRDRCCCRRRCLRGSAGCSSSLCWPPSTAPPSHHHLLPLQVVQCRRAAPITRLIRLGNRHLKIHHKNGSCRGCSHPFAHQLPPGDSLLAWAGDQDPRLVPNGQTLCTRAASRLPKAHLHLCCCQREMVLIFLMETLSFFQPCLFCSKNIILFLLLVLFYCTGFQLDCHDKDICYERQYLTRLW